MSNNTITFNELFYKIKEAPEKILDYNNIPINIINMKEPHLNQNLWHLASQILNKELATKILRFLKKNGANISKDVYNQSYLFYLFKNNNIKSINEFFIDKNIDINEVDKFSQTPIFYAAKEGNIDILTHFHDKINLNHKDSNNETCLFYAVKNNKIEFVKELMKYNCHINLVDKKKQTCLFYAKFSGLQDMDNLLKELGILYTKDGKLKKVNIEKLIYKLKLQDNLEDLKSEWMMDLKKEFDISDRIDWESINNIPKVTYRLIKTNENLDHDYITEENFNKFKTKYPELCQKLFSINPITEEEIINSNINWKNICYNMISSLMKIPESFIFNKPVDPERQGIKSYFQIIKNPMDFSTIKRKTSLNMYENIKEFIVDIELVFSNCIWFNGVYSDYGKSTLYIKKHWEKLKVEYNINRRFLIENN